MAPRVMTVSGPIPPEKLGFTLPHEHTGISLWHIANRWDYWELTPDDDLIIEELREFRRRGGGTLVDLTPPGVGRDPDRLRRLASASGVNIVMGTGWYREAYYPAEALIDRRSVDDLAAEMVRELEDGVGVGGIRPGIIGEIGTDKPWVSAREERVHPASGRRLQRPAAVQAHAEGDQHGRNGGAADQVDRLHDQCGNLKSRPGHQQAQPGAHNHRIPQDHQHKAQRCSAVGARA